MGCCGGRLERGYRHECLAFQEEQGRSGDGYACSQEVAKAYLGKAYLFQKNVSEAASVLNEVVDSKKYDLFRGDYDMQFHAVNNNNCESMLELQWRNDQEQAWSQMDMTFLMQGWRTGNMTLKGKAADEVAQETYGFLNPRKSLYDAFVKAEGKNGYRLQKTLLNSDQISIRCEVESWSEYLWM